MREPKPYAPKPIRISRLLKQLPFAYYGRIPGVKICGIVADHHKVEPGYAFVAIKGSSNDGLNFLEQVQKAGGVLVISDRPKPAGLALPYLQVKGDMHTILAYLAAGLHGFPARQLRMIGVTGTDGKTTTSTMVYEILRHAGKKVGMVSTINAVIGDEVLDTGFHVTTPDAPDIQAYLGEMVARGIEYCVLETTSHGLHQGRVIACDFDIAAVTNVTHEHLDYHGNYQNYLQAKGILFEMLSQTPAKEIGNIRLAVLNKDDESYAYLKRVSPKSQTAYSRVNEAELWADQIEDTPNELRFTCHWGDRTYPVRTHLVGAFNVSNALAAISVACIGLEIPVEVALETLASMHGVAGRMEKIDLGQTFQSIVDFAHTPNALDVALTSARNQTKGRVIAVFGSAGLRDREKRKMMPMVAIRRADLTILTAEDPRTESLDAILQDMAEAALSVGGVEGRDTYNPEGDDAPANFWRIADRPDAIRKALSLARPGDLVISCGKGHEQSMCFGLIEYPWDDRVAMRVALAELLGLPSAEKMPELPTSSDTSLLP
ncbi:MAG TPA: UDP-N-acetylmuramoyl-L-alanyl-D-glutamate--2,6-diaminopimelate ligase [Anaerolineaceae bacterium]|nr:UDP-N-acetylmuramoyl-L-alanyl-D-glutamate--2,6-diaminopimelate ligase [Anaerolineaceae bacterium]